MTGFLFAEGHLFLAADPVLGGFGVSAISVGTGGCGCGVWDLVGQGHGVVGGCGLVGRVLMWAALVLGCRNLVSVAKCLVASSSLIVSSC